MFQVLTLLTRVRFVCVALRCIIMRQNKLLFSRHISCARRETVLLNACDIPAVIVKGETQNRYAIACPIIGVQPSRIMTQRNTTHAKAFKRDRLMTWEFVTSLIRIERFCRWIMHDSRSVVFKTDCLLIE